MASRASILDQTPNEKYEAIMDDLLWYMEDSFGAADVRAIRLILAAVYAHTFHPPRRRRRHESSNACLWLPCFPSDHFPPQFIEATGDTKILDRLEQRPSGRWGHREYTMRGEVRIRFRVKPPEAVTLSAGKLAGLRLRIHNLIDPDFREPGTVAAEPDMIACTLVRLLKVLMPEHNPMLALDNACELAGAHANMMGKEKADAEEVSLIRRVLIDRISDRDRDVLELIPSGYFTLDSLKDLLCFPVAWKNNRWDNWRRARAKITAARIIPGMLKAGLIVNARDMWEAQHPYGLPPRTDRKRPPYLDTRYHEHITASPRLRKALRGGWC
jgi:hypothetical protein